MEFTGGYIDPIMDALYDGMKNSLVLIGFPTVPVIFSMNNSPENMNTYCLIDILSVEQFGMRDEGSHVDSATGTLDFTTHYKINFQVAIRGDSAGTVASSLHHNMNNRNCFEEFHKRNLGILNKTPIRRAPQLRETKWVDGYNFDMNMTFSILTRQSADWVEYFSINGEVFKLSYEE